MKGRIVAMWSGPRNLSTAMMRSFENRPDTVVWDEPFYAAYLNMTGLPHPMVAEVIAAGMTDPDEVRRACLDSSRAPIFYQKHMTHHMIQGVDRGWITQVSNAFLIRHPARVVASYGRKHGELSLSAIGFQQQLELFELVQGATGKVPTVIDAADIRSNPRGMLLSLCNALEIPFSALMLSWPSGPRKSDGAWAPHWYDSVERSTGFAPPETDCVNLSSEQQRIVDAALPIYEKLAEFKLSETAV